MQYRSRRLLVPIKLVCARLIRLPDQTQRRSGGCAQSDYLTGIEVSFATVTVDIFVSLDGARDGWSITKRLLAETRTTLSVQRFRKAIADDQLHQWHDFASKGVMITHRNAYLNTVGRCS